MTHRRDERAPADDVGRARHRHRLAREQLAANGPIEHVRSATAHRTWNHRGRSATES
jgi:hypothetical protein